MMSKMRRTSMLVPVAAAIAVATAGVPGAGATPAVPVAAAHAATSTSGLTSIHGTVTSVSTADRTFRLRRASGASLTLRVTSATIFERVSGGLASLRGKAIEVKARKVDGRWTARKVEAGGAGDDNGGASGGGGSDDGAGHDAGDDHGSGGHGSDD